MLKWLKHVLWGDPLTHDLSQTQWGRNSILTPINKNRCVGRLIAWHPDVRVDDFIVLKHGNATTRYKVTRVAYLKNRGNLFVADVVFAPRW